MTFGNLYIDCTIRIAAGLFCGVVLGIERKLRQHTVGFRTLILISISSALMSMISVFITQIPGVKGGDPTRIAAGVITGIGFLGGGAILREGLNIRGLTSAAIIWTAAALGIACGIGEFFAAALTLSVSILSLIVFERLEIKYFPAEKTKYLTVVYSGSKIDIGKIQQYITDSGLLFRDINMSASIEKNRTAVRFSVKASCRFDLGILAAKLKETGSLIKISISDSDS
ncbi:MAG: MgtC/SapB family protein [Treponema sp.]